MKQRVIALLLVLFLVLCGTVTVFAVQKWMMPSGFLIKDNIGYIGPLQTSGLTAQQQAFLKEWRDSDKALLFWQWQSNYTNGFYTFVILDGYVDSSSVSFSSRFDVNCSLRYLSCSTSTLKPSGNVATYPRYSFSQTSSTGFGGIVFSKVALSPTLNDWNMNLDSIVITDSAGIFPLAPVPHNLTVKYQYEDKTKASESVVQSLVKDDSYYVTSPEIAGFTPNFAVVSGSMPDEDLTIVVTYKKDVVPRTLTIIYQYENGSLAAEGVMQSLAANTSFNIPSPEIEGFTPDLEAVFGTMPDEDITVTVTYKPLPVFYSLTIHYRYSNGAEASPTITQSFLSNLEYSIASPEIEGFTANRAVVSGKMLSDATIVVTYTPKPSGDFLVVDKASLDTMFLTIWSNAGTIVQVAIYLFLACLSVYSIIAIVKYFVLGGD